VVAKEKKALPSLKAKHNYPIKIKKEAALVGRLLFI
jgi:hypothetical protein